MTRDLPFPASSGLKALEIGCGNGKTIAGLHGKGWEVTGLDYSSHAITLCRSTLMETCRGRLVVADAQTLPFSDESFDLVLLIHVLGHMNRTGRGQMVRECVRVLKNNGSILFRDFSTRDFRFGKGTEVEPGSYRRGNGILTHYFTNDEICSMIPLTAESVSTSRWTMRVRGIDLMREEIDAIFKKELFR
jgi:ubiquinone/menaquinone biosynthesis C-methylase UbiE